MKEYKEEAKRHHERKLESYGGKVHRRAHGGKLEHEDGHPHRGKDLKLIKTLERDHEPHKADGGPIMGGSGPKMGRARKPGMAKGKTNIMINAGARPGAPDGIMPPPAGGLPVGLPPPRPVGPPPAAMAPRPPMGPPGAGAAGPMKRGGAAKKEHHGKKHEEKKRHH